MARDGDVLTVLLGAGSTVRLSAPSTLAASTGSPFDRLATVRVTYLTINALRAVASLEFGPVTAGRDDHRTA